MIIKEIFGLRYEMVKSRINSEFKRDSECETIL